jgi:outer membrane receptor for ferrienterochelin and colicins
MVIFAPVKSFINCIGLFILFGSVRAQDTLPTRYLEEVVITGEVEPQSARKSVYQVRTISLDRITSRGAVRLQDVLNTELNIRFSEDQALGGSNLAMQGLSGQNVKVLVDGVPLVGRQGTSNQININQINVNSIDRIEIIEGPMSVMYGADALAGVINIITRKSVDRKLDITAKLHEESVGSEFGVGEGIHNQSVGIGYAVKRLRFRTDFNHNYFGGWQGEKEGRDKQWHPKTQYMASGLMGYETSKTNVFYRIDYLFEDIYNPGEYTGGEALDQHYYTNRVMHQVQGAFSPSSRWQLSGSLGVTNYERETQTTVVNQSTGDEYLSTGSGHQDLTKFAGLTFRTNGQYRVNDKISLQPGIDLNYEQGSGGRIKEGTQTIEDYALFVAAEWKPTTTLQLKPGLRMIYNSVYEAPPVVPSLNVKINVNERHDVRLAYGRGFRAPSLRELYFDFFDSNHAIEGNTDLEAELSHSVSGSWNFRTVQANGGVATVVAGFFYNDVANMIGFGQKPDNALITTYLNVDTYKTTGFTLNTGWKREPFSFNAGVGYTGRYNQLTEAPDETSVFIWSPEATFVAGYRMKKINLEWNVNYKYTGQTPFYEIVPAGGGSEVRLAELGDYHWADVTATKGMGKHVSCTAGIRNLFNVTEISSTASTTGVHTGAGERPIGYGRSFFVSVSFVLSK